jgi:tripartite-type tricarboxylate transporter receptor subunit TctC
MHFLCCHTPRKHFSITARGDRDRAGMPTTHEAETACGTGSGPGGGVGAEIAAKSPADGHTIMFTTNSIAVNVSLYPKLNYNLFNDFQPVAFLASGPLTLVTHPLVPAKSVKELIDLARARPGQQCRDAPRAAGCPWRPYR